MPKPTQCNTARLAILNHFRELACEVEEKVRWKRGDTCAIVPIQTAPLPTLKIAHQIQISPVTVREVASRTEELLSLGLTRVHWYFGPQNVRPENINWVLNTHNVQAYALSFEEEGATWEPCLMHMPMEHEKFAKAAKETNLPQDSTIYCIGSDGQKWTWHRKKQRLLRYGGKVRQQHLIEYGDGLEGWRYVHEKAIANPTLEAPSEALDAIGPTATT